MDEGMTPTHTGQEPEPTDAGSVVTEQPQGVHNEPEREDKPKPDVFDREYVEQLRREAASYRVKAQQAQEALDALRAELDRKEQALAQVEQEVRRRIVEQAVVVEATRLAFYDPSDAVRLLDVDALPVEDGKVSGVAEAVAALAQAKPHLVRRRATSDAADTGAEAVAATMNERIRRAARL